MNLVVIGNLKIGRYYIRLCGFDGLILNEDFGITTEIINEELGDASYEYIKRGLEKSDYKINIVFVDDDKILL